MTLGARVVVGSMVKAGHSTRIVGVFLIEVRGLVLIGFLWFRNLIPSFSVADLRFCY